MIVRRSPADDPICRDLSRPITQGMNLTKGLEGDAQFLYNFRSIAEDFERSRKTRVLSRFTQSRLVHKEGHDTNTSLQARQTWVRDITHSHGLRAPQKSATRAKISGGSRLIGAILFFQDRTSWSGVVVVLETWISVLWGGSFHYSRRTSR